jgi:hypothetical protein
MHVRNAFDSAQVGRVAHFDQYGFHRPMMVTGDDETRFIVRGEKVILWEGGKYFLNFLQSDLLRELGESFRENARHPLHCWWAAVQAQAATRSPLGPERGLMSTVAVLSFFTVALRLLELLLERDKLPKTGPRSIDRRRKAISDAFVNYLITTTLEAYDWNEDVYRVPASLVVLIRNQLCGSTPDLHAEFRLREHKKNVAIAVAQQLKRDERLSINKLKQLAGIPRTTAARWLNDPYFQRWLDFGREQPWKGLLKKNPQRASKTSMNK